MQLFALLVAGFWFVSETLVQLNLYRFSIYPKLLSCIALAWLLWDRRPAVEPYLFGILLLFVAACGGVLLARPGLRNLQVSFFFFSISVGALTSQARVRRGLSWALLFGICFTLVIYTAGHHQLPVGRRLRAHFAPPPGRRSLP